MTPHLIGDQGAVSPRVYSVSAAAKVIGVSRSHLYEMKAAGLIRFGKLLGKTVVTASEIDRVISSIETDGEIS